MEEKLSDVLVVERVPRLVDIGTRAVYKLAYKKQLIGSLLKIRLLRIVTFDSNFFFYSLTGRYNCINPAYVARECSIWRVPGQPWRPKHRPYVRRGSRAMCLLLGGA